VVEIKDKESNPDSESDSKNTGKRQIIDANPPVIVVTATIQPEEPADPPEEERLFNSQMWVKGTPLHFIVDSGSQKNLISTEVVKQLGLSTTPPLHPYNIGWLCQGDIFMSSNNFDRHTTSNPSRMRYYVMLHPTRKASHQDADSTNAFPSPSGTQRYGDHCFLSVRTLIVTTTCDAKKVIFFLKQESNNDKN
jgi:hypothetical protein